MCLYYIVVLTCEGRHRTEPAAGHCCPERAHQSRYEGHLQIFTCVLSFWSVYGIYTVYDV